MAFIGLGGYFIATQNDYNERLDQLNLRDDDDINVFDQFKAQILVCSLGSIIVSFIYIFLIKLMPRVMVISLIFLSLGMLAVLAIVGIITGNIALTIIMVITLLVYGIILACFRNRIKMGIVLVKVATSFFTEKPIVFLTPIIKIFLTILFAVFWIIGLAFMQDRVSSQQALGEDSSFAEVSQGIWVLLWLFFTFFFYYLMVFTIAVTCSFWYYDIQGRNPITTAYKWFYKSAFGSVTFASLVIAIVTFVRMIVDSKRKNQRNAAVAICLCIVSCLMKQIEALLQILNHFSIICMAVTGENFIDSAKSTIGIICSEFPLFTISRFITSLLVFWGVIISVGIPTVLGIVWMNNVEFGPEYMGSVVLMIILSSILLSGMIFSILVESVSSVFVFYCFDKRFRELGFESHNMPAEINDALNVAGNEANQTYEKIDN